jgi:hypothetical protein
MTGVGVGAETVIAAAGEVPPPGAGLTTVMARRLTMLWSVAVSWKVSWVGLT